MSERAEDRWQAGITSLKQGILKIHETKEFHDVEFKFKGRNTVLAHSLVLSARSTVFARMFLNNAKIKEFNITDECITETGFKNLVCFIYSDVINTEDKKEIIETYLAANHYQQTALMFECDKKIGNWTITMADVWEMLDAGLCIPKLKNTCINFIKKEPNGTLVNEANETSPSFLKISFKCLTVILDEDVLNHVPALERIKRIMEWAAKCPDYKTDVDYTCVRKSFLDNKLLKKLGFHTMDSLGLPKLLKYKGLLTDTEVRMFMEYFEDKDETLLPDWCKSNPAV